MPLQPPPSTPSATGRRRLRTREETVRRQIATRYRLLGAAYVVAALAVALLFWSRGGVWTAYSSTEPDGRTVYSSVYDNNPRVVLLLVSLVAISLLVATASLVYRIRRRCPKPGVAGVTVAGLLCIVALFGMLTVGPYLIPLAALLVLVAVPMDTMRR